MVLLKHMGLLILSSAFPLCLNRSLSAPVSLSTPPQQQQQQKSSWDKSVLMLKTGGKAKIMQMFDMEM